MLHYTVKGLLVAAGFICLALGVAALFIPLIPTTPFILLAAYFFSKGSRRLHRWLLGLPGVGPAVAEWEKYHAIETSVKIVAAILIATSLMITLAWELLWGWVKIATTGLLLAVLIYIWSRPTLAAARAKEPKAPE